MPGEIHQQAARYTKFLISSSWVDTSGSPLYFKTAVGYRQEGDRISGGASWSDERHVFRPISSRTPACHCGFLEGEPAAFASIVPEIVFKLPGGISGRVYLPGDAFLAHYLQISTKLTLFLVLICSQRHRGGGGSCGRGRTCG